MPRGSGQWVRVEKALDDLVDALVVCTTPDTWAASRGKVAVLDAVEVLVAGERLEARHAALKEVRDRLERYVTESDWGSTRRGDG